MFRIVCFGFTIATFLFAASIARADAGPTSRPAVVIELFTSEGCSSCPPADDLLSDLARPDAMPGVQIIPLALHVDYWNDLGWADRFSSAQFSDRQRHYAQFFNSDEIYTPQMIVDGTTQFIGSDRQRATAEITSAALQPKGRIDISLSPSPAGANAPKCGISVTGIPPVGPDGDDLMLAITEDDLLTSVPHGENAGKTLHHTAVTRILKKVATILPTDALPFSASTSFSPSPDWRSENLHVVVFVQDPKTGKIVAGSGKKIVTETSVH